MSIKDLKVVGGEGDDQIDDQAVEQQPEENVAVKQDEDGKELDLIIKWKDKCDNIMARLLEAKEARGRWNQECGKLQREFDALYNKGWIAMTQETPLFDGIEEEQQADPDAWKDLLIADADMKDSLKKKLVEHWTTLGELSEWIGLAFPPKMKGIGPKVKDEIAEWFDAFHAPAMEAELERIQSGQADDEYSIDEDESEDYDGKELDDESYDEDNEEFPEDYDEDIDE